ncbi:MAG: bifunctional [glutamate--ammonia ligase]-adenylyl-L-tyrosine phosphorylase/[glutamate--ammonia-ligase] adenylyltransferase [Burkholderiales bacterium]
MVDLRANSAVDPTASLAAALRLSRYARRLVEAEPALADDLKAHLPLPFSRAAMEGFLHAADLSDEDGLLAALRKLRKRVMLRLITRDLSGLADLKEVVDTATSLAEVSLNCAIENCHARLRSEYGAALDAQGQEQTLLIVGMGKLGGEELNVSSDIDLVFVYPEDGMTNGPRSIDSHQYFTLLGKRVIRALHEITSDGFVFRVDMRLRPYGDSGALVSSFNTLEEYFFSQARPWERYAWLKGRVVCRDKSQALDKIVQPFVYRRYLDYGAIADLRDVHAQIRRAAAQKDASNNIKIGPGGIREIEFIAQVFQLIRGGREKDLQLRPTIATLQQLAQRQILPQQDTLQLVDCYKFLRNLEHRLQYLDDAQTQTLPANVDDRALIAESMGFADFSQFLHTLNTYREQVSRHFDAVFGDEKKNIPATENLSSVWQGAQNADALPATFTDANAVLQRLKRMRESSHYPRLPESSRSRLDALIPQMIETASRHQKPDKTLFRLLDLTEAVDRRAAYLALLSEHPEVLERLAKLMAASPWAADYLRQHPILLDELVDTRLLHSPPDWAALKQQIRETLLSETDQERRLDMLRHFKHTQTFRLLAQDIEGLMSLETLSDHLTELADTVIAVSLELCWRETQSKNGNADDAPRFSVIGYGKLGGKELGYVSDLDMIFLYDDDRPNAETQYATLARKLISSLSTLTSAGMLYETDLRLRPDGVSGLLVSSFDAFEDYQHHRAWVWEHQAITRARYVAGDMVLGKKFEALRENILKQPRDATELKKEILAMREKMRAQHKETEGLIDIKQGRGGIIDVEFIVQYLVLLHSAQHPFLIMNKGNIALLKYCGEAGLIPKDLANECADAYRGFRRLQHASRLNNEAQPQLAAASINTMTDNVKKLSAEIFADQ